MFSRWMMGRKSKRLITILRQEEKGYLFLFHNRGNTESGPESNPSQHSHHTCILGEWGGEDLNINTFAVSFLQEMNF